MKRTTTEAELRQWVADRKTAKEIAGILGRSMSSIATTKMILGIGNKRLGRPAPAFDEKILFDGFARGEKFNSIAPKLGFTTTGLRKRLKSGGFPINAAEYWKREALKGKK